MFLMAGSAANEGRRCGQDKILWGSALMNHTYKTVHAANFAGCLLKCDHDTHCKSFNFWWNNLECEFNNATKHSASGSVICKVNCVQRDMDSETGRPDTFSL